MNRLSTAWLVLALIVAPLQAMALPVALLAGNDCPMMQVDRQNLHTVHRQDAQASADEAEPHCPHCVDHSCDDGQCAANGCFSAHMQLSLPGALLVFDRVSILEIQTDFDQSPASLTPPPLLRPPVV